jgi:hypothetical protein
MEALFFQRTASQIHELKIRHSLGEIDHHAYAVGRARILDDYTMRGMDRYVNLSYSMNRFQRLKSFSLFLAPHAAFVGSKSTNVDSFSNERSALKRNSTIRMDTNNGKGSAGSGIQFARFV